MTCGDRQGGLLRLADGELPDREARELRGHLEKCEDCRSALDLFEAENQAIAAALAPVPVDTSPPLARRLLAAAAAVLLLAGGIGGLNHLYGRVTLAIERSAAREQAELQACLDVGISIQAEEIPLEEFLFDLSEKSGVQVSLSAAARGRLISGPTVSITLSQPIRLRSLLALLSEFYDVEPEVSAAGVVLN
jgi:hypothetical protein